MTAQPSDALQQFHPIVREWFTETLGEPSSPQQQGWPAIAGGSHTLILAPTGTGKTLTAFLYELDLLIREGREEPLANAVHVLYVSPLKALSNDVQRNLERPLHELRARFHEAGETFPEIRVGVRTGDTSSAARAKMLRKTPHILITTPESLHLLLTSVRGRTIFSSLRTVIIDEIHAVAGTKRGAHLALTLERLRKVAPDAPQRIGLSATQRPLDEVARYLAGCEIGPNGEPAFRHVAIVDCGLVKQMETAIQSPVPDLAQVDGSIWPAVVQQVIEQIRSARTTLVFVNNRGQAERMAARINLAANEELALPYHGSISRERRFLLEERLKAGELRSLITTSSLELGIDIGSVDLVVQLQSPKRVSSALQRVGRAGHSLGEVSRGFFVPTFRDDALEQMAIVAAMSHGDVEPTQVVQNALDVLAQLIVTMVASDTPEWRATDLFAFVRSAYPFHRLSRNAFDETLAMLSGKYPPDIAAELDARLHWDPLTDLLTPARSARMVATISGGTIPDRGLYGVYLADKTRLGELDEEFVHESRVGDAFNLGSSTWRISAIEHDRVVVFAAPGAPARMPFWHGEFMARSVHLAKRVGELRRDLVGAASDGDRDALQAKYHADESTVQSLIAYARAQKEITGIVPDETHLVLEHFRDEVGSVRMVLHAPFGGRVNAPWGMALGRRMRETLGVEVQVQTTDDGIMLRLPNLGAAPPTAIFAQFTADEIEKLVIEEISGSALFGARFRMNAARALLLPRGNPRKRMPLWLQRLKSADLLQAVSEFPSFPIVVETYRDVLQDAFDMAALRGVIQRVRSGAIPIHVVQTSVPSPFAQSLQFGFVIDWMYADDTPRAESRASLLSLDRALLDELLGGEGADDETLAMLEVVLAERRGTAPERQARDADELILLLDRAGDLTREELRQRIAPDAPDLASQLLESGRMVGIDVGAARRFILVDAFARYAAALGVEAVATVWAGPQEIAMSSVQAVPESLRHTLLSAETAMREVVARFVALAGPFSVADITARYPFDEGPVLRAVEMWERNGILVRGTFGKRSTSVTWCSRRTIERARRRELARARQQVEAVSLDRFAAFMQQWQHVAGDKVSNEPIALDEIMPQLIGIARPAQSWDQHYLPARIAGYDPATLDAYVARHRLAWAIEGQGAVAGQLRFFERGSGRLWLGAAADEGSLSARAIVVLNEIRGNGASFTDELESLTKIDGTRMRDALRELVMSGFLTNDTVAGMRDVTAWSPHFPATPVSAPDPTRWLPDSFVVQRRVNLRRLPRWKRPEFSAGSGEGPWSGRWSLVHLPGLMGMANASEEDDAEAIARQWLARYGVVSREWWGRERPAVRWRAIYQELKRLEFRGEVRRGYFVAGLTGAQFAVPEAVELLRSGSHSYPVALTASDPANVHAVVRIAGDRADALARPRGPSAVVVTVEGRAIVAVEGRGKRWRTADGVDDHLLRQAIDEAVASLRWPGQKSRDIVVEQINGESAATSPLAPVFALTGFQRSPSALRLPARIS